MVRRVMGRWRSARYVGTSVVIVGLIGVTVAVGVSSARENPYLLSARPVQPAPERWVPISHLAQALPFVHRARLSRPLGLDGGTLVLTPAEGHPRISEQQALALFRKAQPDAIGPGGLAVVFADATLRGPDGPVQGVATGHASFAERPVWAVLWSSSAAEPCPLILAGHAQSSGPKSWQVGLISADGPAAGVLYTTRGTGPCGGPVSGPRASYGIP
jgi:hypothetical protein